MSARQPDDALACRIRAAIPLLADAEGAAPVAYLDNAATMQMPRPVMDALEAFRTTSYANVHRGVHSLSLAASDAFDGARRAVAAFIGADEQEVVFTSGATDALNRAARMLAPALDERSNIVVSGLEHHSNLLPWRHLSRITDCELRVVPPDARGALDLSAFLQEVTENTRIVALTELSNVTGIGCDLAALSAVVHEGSDALIVADGAQGIVHGRRSVRDLGCDLYAFSGHKLGAPCGIGVLWIAARVQERLEPESFGGGTVSEVTEKETRLLGSVERFEAGTPNIDGAVGLAAALRFWEGFDAAALLAHEDALLARLEAGLTLIEGATVLGSCPARHGCLAFSVDKGSPYDWAKIADGRGVAVRSGHHCAQPYLRALGCDAAVRVSVAPYNTTGDIDRALAAFETASCLLKGGGCGGHALCRERHTR